MLLFCGIFSREEDNEFMIRYHEITPHPALLRYLKCLWLMEREYSKSASEEILWPDGHVELLIHFGNRYVKALEQPSRKIACSFVVGPLTRPIQLYSSGRVYLIGARFLPWGFFSFFHTPMHELRNQLVPFSDLVGRRAFLLEERCSELPLKEAVYALQDDLLSNLRSPLIEPDIHVLEVIRLLQASSEKVAIKDVVGMVGVGLNPAPTIPTSELQSGLSLRQLERRFQEWIGVTPKKMSTIRRFNLARQAILASPAIDLTSLAHSLGYYDYAHFSNDFKTYFGLTPPTFKAWLTSQQATSAERDVVFLQDRPDLLW